VPVDERPHGRPDGAGAAEAGLARLLLLLLLGHVVRPGPVLEVAVAAEREHVPSGPLVADEGHGRRPADANLIDVLHLALPVQIGLLPRQGDEHLDVIEGGGVEFLFHGLERGQVDPPKCDTRSTVAIRSASQALAT
jgi:hypothetical protein